MITLKKQKLGREVVRNFPLMVKNPSDRFTKRQIVQSIYRWKLRMEFWEEEFQQFQRIVNFQLNEKLAHSQAIDQNFHPLKSVIEEEMAGVLESLEIMEQNIIVSKSKDQFLTLALHVNWKRLERQLEDFEKDLGVKKKRFLAMLFHVLPLRII